MTDAKPVARKVVLIVLVSILSTLLLVSFALARRDITKYPSNFTIEGISLGNLSQTEARDRLQSSYQSKWEQNLQLRVKGQGKVLLLPFNACGISYDLNGSLEKAQATVLERNGVEGLFHPIIIRGIEGDISPVMIVSDRQKLVKSLAEIKNMIDEPAVDARAIVKNDSIEYIAHHNGHVLDMEASLLSIEKAISNGSTGPVDIVTREVSPKIKMEEIMKVKDMIGVFVFDLNKEQLGNNEITKLVALTNGKIIIMPGDRLTNETLLHQSSVLINNKKDIARIEGASAFLYDQIAKAFSTAVLETKGWKQGSELQARNELQDPVLVALALQNQKLIIKIFGSQQESKRELMLTREEKVIPYSVDFRVDQNLDPIQTIVQQTGKNGMEIVWYRVVKKDGMQLEKGVLGQVVSLPENAIIIVGPGHITK